MSFYNLFIQPFLLGLSSGLFCVTYCLPFVASYIVMERRKQKEDVGVILKIIFGRLLGYLCFGAFFAILGEQITNRTIDLAMKISLMILSLVLVLYAFKLIKKEKEKKLCPVFSLKNKTPLAMGFLMGIKICPPVLIALMHIFTLHDLFGGAIFFLFFFLGTTVYFLPLSFLGFLNELKEFRLVGRLSALIVGLSFFLYNFYSILKMFNLRG